MVNQIYPPELQLNKANTSYTEAPFLDLQFSISHGFDSSINDKRDDFDIVNVPFLGGDVPRLPSYGVYISQLLKRFVSSGAGSDKNRALPETTITQSRSNYGYELFAKCFLANRKSPYFQDCGTEFT